LGFERFDPAQVLEMRIREVMSSGNERDQSLSRFLQIVAATKPTPAGGSVAALVGALAASLGIKGARLCHHTEAEQQLVQLSQRLDALVQADIEAYEGVARARKIPEKRSERLTEIAVAWQRATVVPLEIAEDACHAGWAIRSCLTAAKPPVRSDLKVAMILAIAAAEAGLSTAQVNIKAQTNHEVNHILLSRIMKAERSLEELKALCYTPPSIH
jgi:glutamate formiminotransferase/glutamate formiminotransferase/formiminotetrahydrofolate cyclodeaminase